jgi:hypothetical protein
MRNGQLLDSDSEATFLLDKSGIYERRLNPFTLYHGMTSCSTMANNREKLCLVAIMITRLRLARIFGYKIANAARRAIPPLTIFALKVPAAPVKTAETLGVEVEVELLPVDEVAVAFVEAETLRMPPTGPPGGEVLVVAF